MIKYDELCIVSVTEWIVFPTGTTKPTPGKFNIYNKNKIAMLQSSQELSLDFDIYTAFF